MNDLIHSIEQSIISKALLARGQKVLLAVSGGLDSMVLLNVLCRFSKQYDWRLVVAHFNHQLRGRSSDADERFVRQAARKLRIPFITRRADVKRFARDEKISVEMAARKLRHDFLARTARENQAAAVAVGHHADDQLELFFLRLLRGTGGEGLAGMKWRSQSSSHRAVTLVRPLLGCSKTQIQQFAQGEKIRFREDKSNAVLDYLRNRFRHELLPLLMKNYQPALAKTTLRLMEVLGAESEFITQTAAEWLKKRQPSFDNLPLALQRRCLQMQVFELGKKADFMGIEHLRLHPGSPLTLRPGLAILRDAAGQVQTQCLSPSHFHDAQVELRLGGKKGSARFGPLRLKWEIEPHRRSSLAAGSRSKTRGPDRPWEFFDAEKVGSTIALRHWQPGDRFQPIGMHKSVKLQDLFSNQKVPRARRHQLVIATASSGEPFWVEGLRISERFKLDASTVRRLKWRWESC